MLEKQLQNYFNFSAFRFGQEEIIQSILDGNDVVALMPTGGGKSLCFQLPAILNNKLTMVISPLIALMKDQVDSLKVRGIPADFINSSLSFNEIGERLADIKNNKTRLLYVAPERLASESFRKLFAEIEVGLLAVDEAHCVSEWGHDFRPDYMLIKDFVRVMKSRPTVSAFTATATPEVTEDIIKNLELKNPQVFARGFDRPNLKFFAQCNLKPAQRQAEVLRIIKTLPGSGIVYTISRKEAESVAGFLSVNNIKSIAYHAGLEKNQRTRIQEDFMENKFKVIVATIAFGMGVDKADIRFVIHAGMPNSLENYYQEAGRAGRDGEPAYCILLHSKKDFALHNYFIGQNRQEMRSQGQPWQEIERVNNIKYHRLEKVGQYATAQTCRRKIILEYFFDADRHKITGKCGGCDICLDFKWENATPHRKRERQKGRDSNTVMQTAELYKQNYTPQQIAKIRSLGVGTIFTHLERWYADGGELRFEDFVSPAEEEQILQAIEKVGDFKKLAPVKEILPEGIAYEQIRLVRAKIQRES